MKYVCPVCGYVYDEVAEGVPWAALAEEWECPVCGAPKSMFRAEQSAPQPQQPPEVMAEESALSAAGDVRLSAAELSAICSNLARGCEKQYKEEERAMFSELAKHYASLVSPSEGDLSRLSALVKECADRQFAAAKAVAERKGDRGAQRAIVWGERVNFILQSLIERYTRGEAIDTAEVWVCSICGFVYIGDTPPEICPVCKVPAFKFEKGGALQ